MIGGEKIAGHNIALLGYGAIAEMHAVALGSLGASIRVVAGPDRGAATKFAEAHGIARVEIDPAAAIEAPDVNAVVVASPNAVHAQQARAALKAGRHVLVEIPLAMSLRAATQLVRLAEDLKLTLMVGHTLRYWEPFLVAQSLMVERRVMPRHVVARALSRRHENVGWSGRPRSWTDNLLWHTGGHLVDMTLKLLGSPVEEVTAAIGPPWPRSALPMDYAITIRTTDGGIGSVSLSYHSRIQASDYLIIGEEDAISIEGASVRSADGPVYESNLPDVRDRGILAQDGDFLDAISTGGRPRTDAREILPAMSVLQAVQDRGSRSSDTSRRVGADPSIE